MANRKRRDRPAGRSKQRRTTHRGPRREPDLLELAADALVDGGPVALLGLASSLLTAIDPRSGESPAAEPEVSWDDVVEALGSEPRVETTALLAALAALAGDDALRGRVVRQAVEHALALPAWLDGIDRTVASTRAVELVDPFGDASEIVVGATLADGQELTAVVTVNHNLGSAATDGFLVPETIDRVIEAGLDSGDEGDLVARPLAPADARARITGAIEYGLLVGPAETETWPSTRPGVEWLVGLLPGGGTGYPRPVRDDGTVDELRRRFLASPFAQDLDDPGDLLTELVVFTVLHSPGDPLRWSPTVAAVFLFDALAEPTTDGPLDLAAAPHLVRAFVRFCHHERGLRPELTDLTIAEIDAMVPDYEEHLEDVREEPPA